jgi:hypothetical protein
MYIELSMQSFELYDTDNIEYLKQYEPFAIGWVDLIIPNEDDRLYDVYMCIFKHKQKNNFTYLLGDFTTLGDKYLKLMVQNVLNELNITDDFVQLMLCYNGGL